MSIYQWVFLFLNSDVTQASQHFLDSQLSPALVHGIGCSEKTERFHGLKSGYSSVESLFITVVWFTYQVPVLLLPQCYTVLQEREKFSIEQYQTDTWTSQYATEGNHIISHASLSSHMPAYHSKIGEEESYHLVCYCCPSTGYGKCISQSDYSALILHGIHFASETILTPQRGSWSTVMTRCCFSLFEIGMWVNIFFGLNFA